MGWLLLCLVLLGLLVCKDVGSRELGFAGKGVVGNVGMEGLRRRVA